MAKEWLTIFDDSDVVPLVGSVDANGVITDPTFSTDPAHARPWLVGQSKGVSAEIDLIEGTASVGEFAATVIDKRTIATDQRTGFVTALLPGNDGYSAVTMRRAVYQIEDPSGVMRVAQNGVITAVRLNDDLSSYDFSIRDIRERERKFRLFNRVTGPTARYGATFNGAAVPSRTPVAWIGGVGFPASPFYQGDAIPSPSLPKYGTCLYPIGPLNGYGRIGGLPGDPIAALHQTFLIAPVQNAPARGTFVRDTHGQGTYRGQFQFPITTNSTLGYPKQIAYDRGWPSPAVDPLTGNLLPTLIYTDTIIFWRKVGSSNWHRVENMPYRTDRYASSGSTYGYPQQLWSNNTPNPLQPNPTAFVYLQCNMWTPNHQDLPLDGTVCDVMVMDNTSPSDDSPLYIEDTWGQFLRDIFDGWYTIGYDGGPTPIYPTGGGYDVALMTQLAASTPIVRFRKKAVENDAQAWLPDNMYKPFGAVPAFNNDGLIAPIFYKLPDTGASLFALTDANTTVEGSSWELTSDGAVNEISFVYTREFVTRFVTRNGVPQGGSDIQSKEIDLAFLDITAARIGGEKKVEYAPETCTSITNLTDGTTPNLGDVVSEVGAALAAQRWSEVQSRFRFGNQQIVVPALRSDPGVEKIVAGDWGVAGMSWMPDFQSQTRGMNRVVQCIGVRVLDDAWKELTLSDAGPAGQPALTPSVGAPVANADGSISISALTVQARTKVVVQYNIAATVPNQSDPNWRFMGSTAVPGEIRSLPLPTGGVVWVRARAEFSATTGGTTSAVPMRASLWTAAQSVTVPSVASVTGLSLSLTLFSFVFASIATSGATAAFRVFYAQKAYDGSDPNFVSSFDMKATPGTDQFVLIPMLAKQSQTQYVDVVPSTGWDAVAQAATGAFGARSRATITRSDNANNVVFPVGRVSMIETATVGTLNVDVADPQGRVTRVEFDEQIGNGNWSGWALALDANSPYHATVALIPKQPSKIAYRIWGVDATGTESIVDQKIVTFSIGGQPLALELREYVATNGDVQVAWNGDTDTNFVKIVARIPATASDWPTPNEVRAATAQPGQSGITGVLVSGAPTGSLIYVSAFAYNADGVESSVMSQYKLLYVGTGSTPLPDITLGAPIREGLRVRFPFSWDSQTTEIIAWTKVWTSGTQPSTMTSIARQAGAVALPPISVSEGITEIAVDLVNATDYAGVTLIGKDPLNQYGPAAFPAAPVQGNSGATAPAAPTAASNTSISSSSTTNSVTTPSAALTTWKIRTRLGGITGILLSDTPVAVAGAHAQAITYPGNAGDIRTYNYTMLDASGVESATGIAVGPLTNPAPSAGIKPAVTLFYDTTAQQITAQVVPDASQTGPVTWTPERSLTGTGGWTVLSGSAVTSKIGTATVYLQIAQPQSSIGAQQIFIRVRGVSGGVAGAYGDVDVVQIPAASTTGGGGGGSHPL